MDDRPNKIQEATLCWIRRQGWKCGIERIFSLIKIDIGYAVRVELHENCAYLTGYATFYKIRRFEYSDPSLFEEISKLAKTSQR